ncbi:MAG: histidine phosphatase family protein [Duncaniella sp.]|uniref:histidine-type phosphatase n=1 Tax=Duncaniella sp. TaxID=2518496 RepID=UPI0023C60C19|nr:histidine-type phosphatase [Duncaniella sp.]MDE6089326.1 histidine phosphatase family protein [Duncaniella sp.]
MKKLHFLFSLLLGVTFNALAVDPTATDYSFIECQGSANPYPDRTVRDLAYPDSLKPVYLNHVGRHGARFLSSSKYTTSLLRTLHKADSLKTITPMGRELIRICDLVVTRTAGRWGALDSLGMAEQRAIASRAFMAYRPLFDNTKINAISSYVPRCVMSMDEFTHQLTRLNNKVEIYMSSGRQNSPLVRPWHDDEAYKEFMAGEEWHKVYEDFLNKQVPVTVAERALGKNYPFFGDEARDVSLAIYKVLAGCAAMSVQIDLQKYFTQAEINALWSVENLHHYLTHSASTLSSAAPDLASKLLSELISTIDTAIAGSNPYSVMLRFGHAETMMPLLALMHIPGCYYMTNYFDTVGLHWRDFYVVPMASNLQMILFQSESGKYYVRVDLNETPVPLIPGQNTIYIPWQQARDYLNRCLPLHYQV